MLKAILIALGSLFLGLGFVGIVVPGLPTTPFLLLSAACYVKTSERLYSWLINHKILGKYIGDFVGKRAMTMRSKIISISMMSIMIILSVIIAIPSFYVKIIVLIFGMIGILVIVSIPTIKNG